MPEISIIVPVYKVEKYIHRCIDSILAETFGDFELILVDDGSPDRCGELVDISRCGGAIYNLQEVLLKRRHHEKRISSQHSETQRKCSMKTQEKLLCELLGKVSAEEAALHYRYFYVKNVHDFTDACKCVKWAAKLIGANHRTGIYSKTKFDLYTAKLLLLVIGQSFMPSISTVLVSWRNRLLIHKSKH